MKYAEPKTDGERGGERGARGGRRGKPQFAAEQPMAAAATAPYEVTQGTDLTRVFVGGLPYDLSEGGSFSVCSLFYF